MLKLRDHRPISRFNISPLRKLIGFGTLFWVLLTKASVPGGIAQDFDFSSLARVAVLYEGRVQPIDSIARVLLTTLSGGPKMGSQSANDWYFELLFEPQKVSNRPIFNIEDPSVSRALGLKESEFHRYSFDEVTRGFLSTGELVRGILSRPENDRSQSQNHILELRDKVLLYSQIRKAPPPFAVGSEFSQTEGNYLNLWEELRQSYISQNFEVFRLTSLAFFEESRRGLGPQNPTWKIDLEVWYNILNPLSISLGFYLAAMLLVLMGRVLRQKNLSRLGRLGVYSGLSFHLMGILARVLISGRPPVTSLYESIVFVSAVSVILAVVFIYWGHREIGAWAASLAGSILLFVSTRYEVSGGSFGVLIAVLDTNFWLATHVVSISIGYGACLFGGLLGHIYLLLVNFRFLSKPQREKLFRSMVGVSLIALFFSILGTMLGGIWADQSWGRFWGWDPKENGALAIVLWLLFLLHGRLSRIIGPLGFATGMVITNIIVALAWFGVNLLGVGLHSYGFTNSISLALSLFCGLELVFATLMYALNTLNDILDSKQQRDRNRIGKEKSCPF